MSDLSNAADKAGTFIKNAAVGAVKSVEHDATTLVGKNVSVGARVEAGLDLAADAVSVATLSPEDAAGERIAVTAVKEAVEHAPEIAKGAEVLAKEAVEHAPEVVKAAESVFEKTSSMLEKAGHEIVDGAANRGFLETKNTVYHIVEGAETNGLRAWEHFSSAMEKGKNFAVHAPQMAEEEIGRLRGMPLEKVAEKFSRKVGIADTEKAMEAGIKELEHSKVVEHGYEVAKKGIEKVNEVLETGKKAAEIGKKIIEYAPVAATGVAGYANREKIGELAHHAADAVGNEAKKVEHAVEHAASAAAETAKGLVDDVKHWTPDMSPEHFEQLFGKIRGGTPSPTREAVARTQSQTHELGH